MNDLKRGKVTINSNLAMDERKYSMVLCCPNCQSIEVYEVVGGYTGQIYRCKNCGYRGSFVLEIDEKELDALKKD
jgi:transposase-like protein